MNKQTLIWTLIVAVPVGVAALATGYIYKDTGRLPFQSVQETASTPAPGAQDGENQTAGASQSAAEKNAETATASEAGGADDAAETPVKGPSFDVVGVEPTGETVVAGRSEAGAIVALTANGEVVGKSIANEAGEWTIILAEPLKPGDYDVGLEVHDDKGAPIELSEQRLAVSVPEGGKEQPLVVLNTPEGPSDILQKPDTGQQVAQAADNASSADSQEIAAPAKTADAKSQAGATEVAASTDASAAGKSAPSDTSQAQAGVAAAPSDGASEPEGETVIGSAVIEATDATKSDALTETPSEQTQTAASDEQQGTQEASSGEVASLDSGTSGDTVQPSASATADASPATATGSGANAPTVTVEAVESEQDKVYVAGTGEPGSSVRVYVGEEFQGEAKVNSSGKWLVEGTKNVPEGNVEVRADLIAKDGSAVDARAAVTFEKAQNQQVVLTKVVATGTGAGGSSQGASVEKALPVVIIRKGDNLWRISRRLYGDGVRYTTIYQANQDQIRDPDLIYPGQVFLTPEGDLNWPKPSEDG
ncbi:MAG: LysM peptidoglycan-binding domain-containing protein [Roseibium sp.]|uniref:LysM peptidoglycan-binding domain-containing protein n=1 Tax=Roseibium sp. TaxID=1936156 RepID=UPI0026188D91|nr:LysM peptidoglycan-binding domain-containing protein [Roseibium sp.]MCV0425327.1 LysM peptidoglycan-binding domain-containing protein [Roseibium sp.]